MKPLVDDKVCVSIEIGKKGSNVFRSHTFELSFLVADALLSGNKVSIEIDGYDGEHFTQFKAEGSIKYEAL